MSRQTWVEVLGWSSSDGAALASSTSATSLLPASAKFTLPANFFDYIGRRLRVRAAGRVSTLTTTPGTLTLDVRFGSVVVFNGGAMALNIVAKTNVTWMFEAELECRAVGSGTSANVLGIGFWTSEAIIGTAVPGTGASGDLLLPASAPAAGTGFDSTAAQTVDFFGTWSVSNAANSILCHQYTLESIN